MAPTYAPMMPPPQPHHLVQYNAPTPTPNTYYHPSQQQPASSSPTGKKPANLRVEIPAEDTPVTTAITTTGPPTAQFAPPSALPSQFAHNLPSPSTFYPEFYGQSELPSPLNFSSTPVSGGTAFHWPSRSGSISQQGEYKSSPLAKMYVFVS